MAVETVADAYLELLAARGVECFLGNSGTDFVPIIEAYARREALGHKMPRPITVPHEITAVAMAHGYAIASGRPAVVMVHVIVGMAHALGGIINAARANVPMIFTAGRTPLTEGGRRGARDRTIHWAQESFDQGAMLREFVKWDYELRSAEQLEVVVDRAVALATSEPAGPVFLALPREILAERLGELEYSEACRMTPTGARAPDSQLVTEAARRLVAAREPRVIVNALGRDPEAVVSLQRFAETLALPVFEPWPTYVNLAQDHPLHVGFEVTPYLADADVVVAIETDVPWLPSVLAPSPDTLIIQIGEDPLYSRYPLRGFPVDLALAGSPRVTLDALLEAIGRLAVDDRQVAERRRRWESEHRGLRDVWLSRGRAAASQAPIEAAWLSRAIGECVDADTIVINEYDLDPTQVCFTRPGSYFGSSAASGLGWGLGAALGVKLAKPEKTVIACVGDGAYMFGVPTAAHWVASAYGLPLLVVVFNNQGWGTVRQAVRSYAPEGWSARRGAAPLTGLAPSPRYELVCQAVGGHGERVEASASLPDALRRALRIVREERRQALLDVVLKPI